MLLEEELTGTIIAAAIEVHRLVGPGLLESAYEKFLCHELRLRGLTVQNEVPIPVSYKGVSIDCGFRIDLLVNDRVIVELKAVERMHPIFEAQLITYLKLTGKRVGLIINFHVDVLTRGIVRRVV
jgi:GxxExxY protein